MGAAFLDPHTQKKLKPTDTVVYAGWDRQSRNDVLIEPVLFRDSQGQKWRVPAGATFNGLSVPRIFWRIMPPYAAKAREASVVHDYLCTPPYQCNSETAHAVFYDALRANGVGLWTAWTRWLCVRIFGPRF